ncbi:Hypothetical protein Tpal_231 [Trichococcus palustris]|uniref:Uncharacterized protein n=1 Tax=Trichococcus palustris TaxID=140314 RepID=A0A143Y608_9LACT|nr:hypothetical protein [Trichococcus palustris]CZQ81701.1 Hypothetical protein Tpal_231 [Trichococcus palustris]SFK61979.1 hypothetical protein SAMN04488076_10259 [Trichococcus palustris]
MELKKISSVNGFIFIIDDMSTDVDKRMNIYRGDNILLNSLKKFKSITPFFAKDAQTVKYENVLEITEPNEIEKGIFLTLKAGEELSDDQKSYTKSNKRIMEIADKKFSLYQNE